MLAAVVDGMVILLPLAEVELVFPVVFSVFSICSNDHLVLGRAETKSGILFLRDNFGVSRCFRCSLRFQHL